MNEYFMTNESRHVASGVVERYPSPQLCRVTSFEGDDCYGVLIFSTEKGFCFKKADLRELTSSEKEHFNSIRRDMNHPLLFPETR